MLRAMLTAGVIMAMPLSGAYAEDRREQGSGPNPYTECGIGAALFPDTGWAAATSNATWDLGSTALTSATSSPELCNPRNVSTARLILETLPSLEKDIALGEGEYLTALNATMGCNDVFTRDINAGIRQNYHAVIADEAYPNQTQPERAFSMYALVRDVVSIHDESCAAYL